MKATDFLKSQHREVDEEITLEAYEEHSLVDNVIKKLSKTRTNDETFMARIKVLKDLVDHHVEEEEKEYFPECEKELGEDYLEELGEELEEVYDKLEKKDGSHRGVRLTLAKAS